MSFVGVSKPVISIQNYESGGLSGIHSIAETTEKELFYTYDFKYHVGSATVLLRSVCDVAVFGS